MLWLEQRRSGCSSSMSLISTCTIECSSEQGYKKSKSECKGAQGAEGPPRAALETRLPHGRAPPGTPAAVETGAARTHAVAGSSSPHSLISIEFMF